MQDPNEYSIDFTNTTALEKCILCKYQEEQADQNKPKKDTADNIFSTFFEQKVFIEQHQQIMQVLIHQFLSLETCYEPFF